MTNSAPTADLILHNGRFTTLDRAQPDRQRGRDPGRPLPRRRQRRGRDAAGRRRAPQVIDLKGRRVMPGLIDNHLHIIRGGLNYNLELRWDGVRIARRRHGDAEAAGRASRRRRNGCAWSAASPSTSSPRSACRRSTRSTRSRPTRRCSSCTSTTARCSTAPRCAPSATPRTRRTRPAARSSATPTATRPACCSPSPTPAILYATLAKGPKLPLEYQLNSTRHFMRELNRLGVTGAIDAGGGFQNYPDDYAGHPAAAPTTAS